MSWFCIPCTYSPEPAEESLQTSCLGTLQSALSKSKSIPEEFCSKDNLTEFFQCFPFGMMLRRSGATTPKPQACSTNSGRYQGNSPFVAGSRSCARTSARPEKAQESPEAVPGYGLTWPASSARYDRDLSSWKIHPCLFPEDSIPCSVTLPKWGSTQITASLEPITREHPTKEIEYGSMENQYERSNSEKTRADVVLSVLWDPDAKATVFSWSIGGLVGFYEAEILFKGVPKQEPHKKRGIYQPISMASASAQKAALRALWKAKEFAGTPQGSGCYEQRAGELRNALCKLSQHGALGGSEGQWELRAEAVLSARTTPAPLTGGTGSGLWPTPTKADGQGANSRDHCEVTGTGRKHMDQLANAVAHPELHRASFVDTNSSVNCLDGMGAPIASGKERETFPTPMAGAATRTAQGGIQLFQHVRNFPTPTKADGMGGPERSEKRTGGDNLRTDVGGSLSPTWVCWLMGWPLGWTSMEPMPPETWVAWQRAFQIGPID